MLQVSASLLGEPDVGLLTPPEMARKASQICYAAPTLTVFADADTGTSVRLMPSMQALGTHAPWAEPVATLACMDLTLGSGSGEWNPSAMACLYTPPLLVIRLELP